MEAGGGGGSGPGGSERQSACHGLATCRCCSVAFSARAESTRGGDHARACSRVAVDSWDRQSREAKHSGKGAPRSTEISVRATARTHLGTALARAGDIWWVGVVVDAVDRIHSR